MNNKLSSWESLNGVHDFNKYPLAPPGTKVIIHKKPSDRKSWQFHGEEGFYVAPALNHYRCLTCYIPKTRQEKISDTVTFISKHVPIPEASVEEHIKQTSKDLIHLLLSKEPSLPFLKNNSTKEVLIKIATLLNNNKTE